MCRHRPERHRLNNGNIRNLHRLARFSIQAKPCCLCLFGTFYSQDFCKSEEVLSTWNVQPTPPVAKIFHRRIVVELLIFVSYPAQHGRQP